MHLSNVDDLFSFRQLIQEPTRENLGSRTIIVHIATNFEHNISHHGVIRISMSDHYSAGVKCAPSLASFMSYL